MSTAAAAVRPTQISVTFEIVTPDQLRMIKFNLSYSQDGTDETWSILFELYERSDPQQDLQLVTQVAVDVDEADNEKAAATAATGLDSDQHAQAEIAGDTAKAASDPASGVTAADAQADAQAVVLVRNA